MTTKQYSKRDPAQKNLAAVTLTAVSFGATFGGWALLAANEQPQAAQTPVATVRQVQAPLRSVNGGVTPPTASTSQAAPPRQAPVARTRSSR